MDLKKVHAFDKKVLKKAHVLHGFEKTLQIWKTMFMDLKKVLVF